MAQAQGPQRTSLGNVLVVGGCGFLGHHIVKLLLEQYPATNLHVLDLRTTNNRHASGKVTYHDGDITDYEGCTALFTKLKLDAIIHTASPHPTLPKEVLYKVNVDGTKNLVKVSQETGVKAFVYTSSASIVCDPAEGLINADERWPLVVGDAQPEYYSTTKAYGEIAVLEANRKPSDSFLTASIRPAGIFGEGDTQNLPGIIKAYLDGSTNFQVGDNNNLFDFTYVGNIAHAHILAVSALLATHELNPTVPLDNERVDGEAFFITNDSPVYFWDYTRTIWSTCGPIKPLSSNWVLSTSVAYVIATILEFIALITRKPPNLNTHRVQFLSMTRYYNISKAKARLGYQPIYDYQKSLKSSVRTVFAQMKAERETSAAEKKAQ